MDFDGDKIKDVLSGSFDGPIYLFKGDGKGGYAAGVKLQNRGGSDLQIDEATSISAFDWDQDGLPDLIVGTIQGPVWYVHNLGKGSMADPVRLAVPNADFEALDGGPAAFDWDGDGVMDLFLGEDDGKLRFYKGKAGGSKPEFEPPVDILLALTEKQVEPKAPLAGEPLDWMLDRPGMRPKPTVGDWNGDGKLDLIVGDMNILENRNDKLSPEDKAKYDTLKKKQDGLRDEALKHYDELKKKTLASLGWTADRKLTPEESDKYTNEFAKFYALDKEVAKLDDDLLKVYEEIRPLSPTTDYHGFVWVFLRQ